MTQKTTRILKFAVIALLLCVNTTVAVPGDLDPTFGVGGRTNVPLNVIPRRIRIQPDGKILVLGTQIYPNTYSSISRFNSDGTPDLGFGENGTVKGLYPNDLFQDIWLLGDGRLLVTDYDQLRRLNSDGSIDPTFNIPTFFDFAAFSVAVQPNGRIVVAGANYINYNDDYFAKITRYMPDGSPDLSFGSVTGPQMNAGGYEVVIQPDGKLLTLGGEGAIRFGQDGSLDTGFGINGVVSTYVNGFSNALIQNDGRIVTSGAGAFYGASTIRRFETNGLPDQAFGVGGGVSIAYTGNFPLGLALAIQSNGKILTAGQSAGTFAVARFNSDGSSDTTFGSDGVAITPVANSPGTRQIFALALQRDGKIVAAGDSLINGNYSGLDLIRYIGDASPSTVSISGRALSPEGIGLRNAIVRLSDGEGNVRITTTSSFGIYQFDDLVGERQYTIGVASKRYRFSPRTIAPNTNLTGIDLIGLQ